MNAMLDGGVCAQCQGSGTEDLYGFFYDLAPTPMRCSECGGTGYENPPKEELEERPCGAAAGILLGTLIGAAMWTAIGLAVWWAVR